MLQISAFEQIEKYMPVMKKCRLFTGIPEDQYEAVLICLDYTVCKASAGERILSPGDPFRHAYFLLEGELSVSFLNEAAEKMTLNHFYAGKILGESMAVLPKCYSTVDLESETDSVYVTLNLRKLLKGPCSFRYQHTLLINLMQALAGQNYFLNQKARILGQKKIRDRLMLYFSTLPENSRGFRMIPYTRTELAAYLGLNRSAMVRELGKMNREGVIDLAENQVRIGRRN